MNETWNTGAAVSIRVSPEDFEYLTANSTSLTGSFSSSGFADRFHDPARGEYATTTELEQWRYAYWFDGYANVLLARGFLAAIGEPFLVASDEYVDDGETAHGVIHHVHDAGWVIFTNWASPGWAKPRLKTAEEQ